MTSQGTAHGRFARAVKNRNLLNAEIAAREMGELSLPDALAFCLLLADVDPPRFDRAIARWHARFVLEATGITADEAALALSAAQALAGVKSRETAAQTLRRLAKECGLVASPEFSDDREEMVIGCATPAVGGRALAHMSRGVAAVAVRCSLGGGLPQGNTPRRTSVGCRLLIADSRSSS